ncbi:hypothetical protein G6F57_013963 [Rhizopus arrhizus]|nr:hypothetical protein G6F57_013963 [Rhizopus arrhizus]
MFKRLFLSVSVLAAALCIAPAACAQTPWPGAKPLTLIVPFSPGGNVDTTARLVAQKLAERLNHSLMLDIVAGAGGVLGVARATHAAPDGYTLVMGFDGPISVARLINSAVKYDAEKDLTPVALVTTAPVVLLARPGLPVNYIYDLIALARDMLDTLTYASSGVGTVLHLSMEVMQDQAKVDAITDNLSSTLPQVLGGKLRALSVLGAERSPLLPDVPTYIELGYPDMGTGGWFGLVAPAGTPPAVVDRLNQAVRAAMKDPEFRKKAEDVGGTLMPTTPQEFQVQIEQALARYAKVAKAANIQAD